jgi:CheY-like chemotaxis protein
MMKSNRIAQILLVEDNHMDEVLTLDAFKQAHLMNTIHVARTGDEAIAYLSGEGKYSNRHEFPLPDLILLDIKLPGISGHDVLGKIKQTPGLKRIPVNMLTSSKEEGDIELSYDLGANSYLVKPVSFEGFLKIVQDINYYWVSVNVGTHK